MNEMIMKSVWDESIRQTRQMIRTWTSNGIGSVAGDTRTLSLNVLAAIGFRKSFDFRPRTQEAVLDNGKFSYRDALQLVLDNIIVLLIVPRKYLSYSWLPGWVRKIGKAANDFQLHMEEMLDDELVALNRGENRNSLMTSLVRALDTHQKDSRQGISVEEIFGNLFIVNFAGHDTTANTLAFSTLLLSAFPDVQNWVAEEVDAVMRKTGDAGPSDYSALFPQLLRCKAIMVSRPP
jgi:cytochrome P450